MQQIVALVLYERMIPNMSKSKPFLDKEGGRARKSIRRTIVITERMNEMAEEIAKQKGLTTFTAVVETAISLLHSKTIDYKVLATKNPSTGLSPEELARVKVQKKNDEKKAEQDMKDEHKAKICERMLFGKVETDTVGHKYCVFSVHNKFESKESKVPLSQADPVIARSVFMPDKATVLKARPELIKSLGLKLDHNTKEYVAAEEI